MRGQLGNVDCHAVVERYVEEQNVRCVDSSVPVCFGTVEGNQMGSRSDKEFAIQLSCLKAMLMKHRTIVFYLLVLYVLFSSKDMVSYKT